MKLIAPQVLPIRVKFLTAAMYPRWVPGEKPRNVMSSIIRWRNWLVAVFVMIISCL